MSVQTQDLEQREEASGRSGERAAVTTSPPRERPATTPAAPEHAPGPPETGDGAARAPAAAPAAAEPVVLETPPRRRRLARIVLPIVLLALIVAAVFGYNAWRNSQLYVSTDNAQITGQPVQVGSMNAGRVDAVNPTVGSLVHRGDVLATVALPSQTGTGQSGAPIMGFLGASDTHVNVTAPMDGVVIATPVAAGSTVQAGQAIVTLIDPSQLWVNANVDETDFNRLKVGQSVTVHVDALGTDVPGRVEAITPATAATFSLLPTQNASGNFNKVTQLVPVRISLNLGNQPTLLGSSVEVKISVAE
jgi:multidrug resistance efflux pump